MSLVSEDVEQIDAADPPADSRGPGRFALRFATFVLSIGLLGGSLAALPASPREVAYLTAWLDKKSRLVATERPKVILVGGSNVAFGLSGEQISNRIDRPVVNLGLHVGLGLAPVLREVRETLGPGDVVVVSPEYEFFLASSHSDATVPTMRMFVDPSFGKPGFRERVSEAPARVVVAFRNAGDLASTTINEALGRSSIGLESEIFTREAFNEFGDMVTHRGRSSLGPTPLPPLNRWEVDDGLIDELVRFGRFARSRGARFVMIPPPLDRQSFANRSPIIDAVDRRLSRARVGFAWSPESSVVDRDEVFDAAYHLIGEANDRRSMRLAEWLRE